MALRPPVPLAAFLLLVPTVIAQQPTWSDLSATSGAAGYAALAFDEARAVLLRYGGEIDHFFTWVDETWVHDGARWGRVGPSGTPGLSPSGVVYDPAARRLMRYGGGSRDTLVWYGSAWSVLQAGGGPVHDQSTLGFDRARNRAVLSAMQNQGPRQTWEWTGTAWQQITTGDPAFMTQMTFDPGRGRLLGLAGSDLYEWNGAMWNLIAQGLLPPQLNQELRMSWDLARSTLVFVDPSQSGMRVFEWNGVMLTTIVPAFGPGVRIGAAIAYDPVRQRTILFGGERGRTSLADTWEWDGMSWAERSGGPPAASTVLLARDAARGRVVCFAPRGTQSFEQETWEWDGMVWLRRQAFAQTAEEPTGLAHDDLRGRTVLLTRNAQNNATSTREWNGVSWTVVTGAGAPQGSGPIAYDQARGEIVLFGSTLSQATAAGTWLYNGVSWRPAGPASAPAPRYGHALASDPVRQRVVLFGGASSTALYGDTWEWDGVNWTQVPTVWPGAPSPRIYHAMAYDGSARIALSGGVVPISAAPWFLALPAQYWLWDGAVWTLSTVAPPASLDHAMCFDGTGVLLQGGTDQRTWRLTATAAAAGAGGTLPCIGSLGAPRLVPEGLPLLGNTAFALRLSSVPPGALTLFGFSTQFVYQALGGCMLYLGAPVLTATMADAIGFARLPLPVPSNPALIGARLFAQAGALDAGAPSGSGFALSGYVEIRPGR